MLKKFGYTNLMMLLIGVAILYFYVDFGQPSKYDIIIIALFALTVLIHIFRIILLIISYRKER